MASLAFRDGFVIEMTSDLPTISGSSVGLPANTIYIDPSTGRLYRTT